MNVLIVAAHPDDEVLGCGGTIARLSSEGHCVNVLILGEGITSRIEEGPVEEKLKELNIQAKEVGAHLGVENVILASFPDNRFDTVALLDIIQCIESTIHCVKPDVVYTQAGGDLNSDHQLTFKATMTAVRPMEGSKVRALYAYEVASSTEWAFGQFEPRFLPSRFVDISDFLEKKLTAMRVYEGELRDFPHPRSIEALRANAEKWGAVSGMRAAEAFQIIFERV